MSNSQNTGNGDNDAVRAINELEDEARHEMKTGELSKAEGKAAIENLEEIKSVVSDTGDGANPFDNGPDAQDLDPLGDD